MSEKEQEATIDDLMEKVESIEHMQRSLEGKFDRLHNWMELIDQKTTETVTRGELRQELNDLVTEHKAQNMIGDALKPYPQAEYVDFKASQAAQEAERRMRDHVHAENKRVMESTDKLVNGIHALIADSTESFRAGQERTNILIEKFDGMASRFDDWINLVKENRDEVDERLDEMRAVLTDHSDKFQATGAVIGEITGHNPYNTYEADTSRPGLIQVVRDMKNDQVSLAAASAQLTVTVDEIKAILDNQGNWWKWPIRMAWRAATSSLGIKVILAVLGAVGTTLGIAGFAEFINQINVGG